MTENEVTRNEAALDTLHIKYLEAIQAGKLDEAEKIANMIQKLEHEQTEHEKGLSNWNDVCMKKEIEQVKIEQSDKQFKTQVAVTAGSLLGTALFGIWLEKGNMATVLPLKMFVRKIEQMVLNPFRH